MEVWGGNDAVRTGISVPGLDAWIASTPVHGAERGGDIRYVSMCGGGRISRFVIADVTGHGAAADDLARRLRKLMRKHINTLDQTRLARTLNHELLHSSRSSRFATSLLATYFAPTDQMTFCNLGHPRPLWYHADSGRWERLQRDAPPGARTPVNLPLGVVEPTDYEQFTVRLLKGDLILIHTDSIIESRGPEGRPLGEDGLLDLVRQLDGRRPYLLMENLLGAVAEHHGGPEAEDDETLLVLHHNAADPPRQTLGQRVHVMARMVGLG